jgi:HlyD family secretion protein
VIGPREPLLDVVPGREKIVVEARIRPQDIDHVRKDSAAEVRLSAFESHASPLIAGKVTFVSPDRVSGANGQDSWFVATVELDGDDVERHAGIRLTAGMPAEVYVTTPERTLLDYMTAPLRIFATRAMREP